MPSRRTSQLLSVWMLLATSAMVVADIWDVEDGDMSDRDANRFQQAGTMVLNPQGYRADGPLSEFRAHPPASTAVCAFAQAAAHMG